MKCTFLRPLTEDRDDANVMGMVQSKQRATLEREDEVYEVRQQKRALLHCLEK